MDADLPEENEPSEEQLAALHSRVVKLKLAPYVDMGVWTAHGRRSLRALKFRNWTLNPDGTYTSREMPGPGNFVQWTAA